VIIITTIMVSSSANNPLTTLRENNHNNNRTVSPNSNSSSSPLNNIPPRPYYYNGPSPIIITTDDDHLSLLSPYRTLLPPRPLSPPCKRRIRDALRCFRSGMVPGAMRKYLQTHRNPQVPTSVSENNLIDIDLDSADSAEQLLPPSLELDPVNFDPEPVPPTEEDPPPSSDQMSRKRHFSEAFSPDTTTPTDNEIISSESSSTEPPSPTQLLENDEDSSCSSNSNSSGKFEITLTTPAKALLKPSRPKTPPKILPHKKSVQRRKSRKNSKISKISNSSKSSSSSSSVCRNLLPTLSSIDLLHFPPSCSPYRVSESIDLSLEKSLSRHSWSSVIQSLTLNLEANKILPNPRHVGLIIRKALLGVGVRVPKDIPGVAQNFISQLVQAYPIDADGDSSTDYYVNVFTQVKRFRKFRFIYY